MKISKQELLANPTLARLIDPAHRAQLGLTPPEAEPQSPTNSTDSTLKGVWSSLTAAEKKHLRGTEAKQHGILVAWLIKHQIPHIHAITTRKVHDLPPGWPDFTVFRLARPINECIFLEMKVPGGVLSWEQKYWHKILSVTIIPSALSGMRAVANFCDITLPVLSNHQLPIL